MIDKEAQAKIVDGVIKLTDWQKIQNTYRALARMSNFLNWTALPHNHLDITTIKNDLIRISQTISTEYTHFSNELFFLKDHLFTEYGCFEPQAYGQVMAILKALINLVNNPTQSVWGLIHPKIKSVSKQLYLDGHYSNAAEDAMRRIMFASMLMYKIDDAVSYSNINER